MIRTGSRHGIVSGLASLICCLALTACETEKIKETRLGIQQNLFLQSVELIERAGAALQKRNLQRTDIDAAMQQMDEGLKLAFQVEAGFLDQLDPRLAKRYSSNFIKGVETYRLGVEAANRDRQLEGLDLLRRWSDFWLEEKSTILQQMAKLTGLPTISS